jgi:pyridoxal phosphate enzyme (YggS family)|tara:strand:- start:488 stop:1147 length:660 start_codon:yes stop_codon:yes gene_type:complete
MHKTIQNLLDIQKKINLILDTLKISKVPKIIAVSKTFGMDKISPLIEYGHLDFGENKVQEALEKWSDVKTNNKNLKLHLIGKLQTNKVKYAVKIFDFIHSVDSEKLAKKISEEQQKQKKKVKIFIQVNIGDEQQKTGVSKSSVTHLYSYCKTLNLDVVGLMCIPPLEKSSDTFFKEMNILNTNLNFNELSMGMSSDYLDAIKNSATYIRIGSNIFGPRS